MGYVESKTILRLSNHATAGLDRRKPNSVSSDEIQVILATRRAKLTLGLYARTGNKRLFF